MKGVSEVVFCAEGRLVAKHFDLTAPGAGMLAAAERYFAAVAGRQGFGPPVELAEEDRVVAVRGRPLKEPSTPAERERLRRELLELLARVHAAGVAHRDVRPANLVRGPEGQLWLIDWEFATAVDPKAPPYDLVGPVRSGVEAPLPHRESGKPVFWEAPGPEGLRDRLGPSESRDRPRTAVIVPTCTPALLDLHLRSHALFSPPEVEVVVIWTGPPPGGPGTFFRPPDGVRVPPPGVAAAGDRYSSWCHDAALRARDHHGAELLVFANDDTVVHPGWWEMMLAEVRLVEGAGRKLGLLGACTNHATGNQWRVPYPHGSGAPLAGKLVHSPFIATFFAACLTERYFEAGGFDLELPSHNFSDAALSMRMLRAGMASYCSNAFVTHFGSRTFERDPEAAGKDLAAGKAYMDRAYPGWGEALFPGGV